MTNLRDDMRDRETAEQMVVTLGADNRDLVFPWDFVNLDQADCFRIKAATGSKQQASLVKVMAMCMATHTVVVVGDSRMGKTVLARALAKACAPQRPFRQPRGPRELMKPTQDSGRLSDRLAFSR